MGARSEHIQVLSREPVQLSHMRHGYHARWHDMSFSVEENSGDWELRIEDSGGSRTLYTASRIAARAAQAAAAEFATLDLFLADSQITPGRFAGDLKWEEYWSAEGGDLAR